MCKCEQKSEVTGIDKDQSETIVAKKESCCGTSHRVTTADSGCCSGKPE